MAPGPSARETGQFSQGNRPDDRAGKASSIRKPIALGPMAPRSPIMHSAPPKSRQSCRAPAIAAFKIADQALESSLIRGGQGGSLSTRPYKKADPGGAGLYYFVDQILVNGKTTLPGLLNQAE